MSKRTLISNIYNSTLPKEQRRPFREKVIKETGVHFTTFYAWMNGTRQPNELEKRYLITTINEFLPKEQSVSPEEVQFGAYAKVS